MRSLKKPTQKVADVFSDCLKIRRDKSLKARLECVKALIENAEMQYEVHGAAKELFLISPSNGVGTCVSTSEMEGLYTDVFARKTSKMRPVYDEIKLASDNDICPLCAQRTVSTLDHYLPKAKNPTFAVTPLNLIPACFECNHIKDEHHPGKAEEQILHPYFDVLGNDQWLFIDIGQTQPPSVTFSVRTPDFWDSGLAARLNFHFSTFELAKLYSSQAGTTLSGIAAKLESAWKRGGEAEVRFILQEDAVSWERFSKNSWQAALYRGLVESKWFCSEGYALIACP